MSCYDFIAFQEGTIFTIWGPCSGGGETDPCDCEQCKFADKLAAEGKDYCEEYARAKAAARLSRQIGD